MAMTPVLLMQKSQWPGAAKAAPSAPDIKPPQLGGREESLESDRRQEKMVELLKKIEENTANMVGGGKVGKAPTKDDGGGIGIGVLGTALAVGLGAIVGYIKGYVKLLGKLAETLTPEKWIAAIKNGFNKVLGFFEGIAEFVGKGFEMVKKWFSFGEESKIGKIISSLREGVTSFFSKIEAAGAAIKNMFTVVKDSIAAFFSPVEKAIDMIKAGSAAVTDGVSWFGKMFNSIKGFLGEALGFGGNFVKIFKGTMVIFEKLAWPLTAIMTLWDTLKGAFAGWEKDGLVGAYFGAIKGFYDSLIFGPLDMIKDAISWILGIFGFDNAKKALDSFSFVKMFDDMIDSLIGPFKFIQDKVLKMWEEFSWDNVWGSITGYINESIDSVVSGFGRLKDGIIEWWDSWSIDGVITSIGDQASEISDAISKWFSQKFDKMKSFFGFGGDSAAPPAPEQEKSVTSKLKNFIGFKDSGTEATTVDIKESKTLAEVKRNGGADVGNSNAAATGKIITASSAEAEDAKVKAMKPQSGGNANVVNAPVTNNNTQNQIIRPPIRNQDSSVNTYLKTRYA